MSEVMDPATLSVLSARELQRLISGEGAGSGADAEWEYAKIMASVVCKHGYSVESSQVSVCFVRGWMFNLSCCHVTRSVLQKIAQEHHVWK